MASLTAAGGLSLHVEWDRPDGVAAAELAATWCALEIRVNGRSVTLIEDTRGGGVRRAIHTSAYPLAEWIAQHWWSLMDHVRPSAVPTNGWTWRHASPPAWLRAHNVRGAGDGMPWPDLTLVPEGAVTRAVWGTGPGLAAQPVIFLSSGTAYLAADDVATSLTNFVEQVLDRLREADVRDTPLQQEWQALADLDEEERAFARTAARLGLDPFDVDERMAAQIEQVARRLDSDLRDEFFDSAQPECLLAAAEWLDLARSELRPGATHVDRRDATSAGNGANRPWERGYAAARAYRTHLGVKPSDRIELGDQVGLSYLDENPAGLRGLVGVVANGVGLVLPSYVTNPATTRFAQARALGLAVLTTRSSALLDPASTETAKTTKAFAAELLAPAEGIAAYLSDLPTDSDVTFDEIAQRYDASPVVVQHQYENQLSMQPRLDDRWSARPPR